MLLAVNRVLIALFALASGVFKIAGGRPDLELFAKLGMTPLAVAIFGGVQALGGVGLIFRGTRKPAAVLVALCNTLATIALFVAGTQPFGAISILFIVMALLVLATPAAASQKAAIHVVAPEAKQVIARDYGAKPLRWSKSS